MSILKTLEHNTGGHSIFSPSSSKMWMTCAGSLIPNVLAPNETTEAAAEGTVAHEMAELWLNSRKKPRHLIGEIKTISDNHGNKYDIEITGEMLAYVGVYVDEVMHMRGDSFVEVRVDLSKYLPIPNQGGTADFINIYKGHMTVVDLKYGIGIFVDVIDNSQLMMYALGAYLKYKKRYDIKTIEIKIVQPRKNNISSVEVTIDELMAFSRKLARRARMAWKENAERVPDVKGCEWCKVISTCSAAASLMDKHVDLYSDSVSKADMAATKKRIDSGDWGYFDPDGLTLEQMEKIYVRKALFTRFFSSIEKQIYGKLCRGEPSNNFKLVDKLARRSWLNELDAISMLEECGLDEDEFMPRKMISPAEAEKLLLDKGLSRKEAEEVVKAVVVSRSSGVTFAPLTDKRQAYGNDDGVFD